MKIMPITTFTTIMVEPKVNRFGCYSFWIKPKKGEQHLVLKLFGIHVAVGSPFGLLRKRSVRETSNAFQD